MGSGAKKRREHEEDFIAFPSDSPSPTSSPSPSYRRERNLSQISLERNPKKLLRKMVSDDVQKLMGEFGSAEVNRPKWNPRTQMFDLKENDTPAAERTNQVPQKDKKKNGREKRGQEEILEPNKQEPVLSIQELYDLMMSSPEGNIETKEERKKRRAEKKTATMRTLFEKKFSPLVAMFPEDEKLVAAAKKSMLEDISRPPPEGVELDIRGNFLGYFPTEDKVVDKREKKKRKREAKKPAQEQDLSKLEEMSQREADEAVVEAPKKKKKKRKMNHNSSEERPHQSSAMSVYSSNPHKLREKKSTVTDLVGNGSEDLQASPTFLIPTSFLTKGFAKQQALLGTILKSCNFKSPNAPKSTYDNVDMTANYNHHESAILPRKLSITSSSTDDCPPTTVKKPGHVATRTPITPLKSTKPKPSRTKTRPAPLTDDSDSEVDSPVVVTQANQPTGDNGIEWEQSFSKVVASLKKTSVSKIKALFNEDSETSGEGESLSKVVNSIKQATSVDKIRFIFSPGRAAANGAGKRRMSISSPTVSSKANSDHSQHLQFRAIATCRPPSTTVSSNFDVEHSRHLQLPAGCTFQLLHIASGHDEALPVLVEGYRTCSVAKGRVVVAFGKKFKISEGKVWIVRRGEVCVVHNPSSEEATVHIVTVDGA